MRTNKKNGYCWAIWFVGLPGAGKSTYAQAVHHILQCMGDNVYYMSMDERHKAYFRNPEYTDGERGKAYRLFAEEAAHIVVHSTNVIMDGTGPKLFMREYARALMPRFAEVFVRCSLETAMRRERNRQEGLVMTNLYARALQRKRTGVDVEKLGQVVGVDIPFEEDPLAECVIDSENESIEAGCNRVLDFLAPWL